MNIEFHSSFYFSKYIAPFFLSYLVQTLILELNANNTLSIYLKGTCMAEDFFQSPVMKF